MQIPQQAQTHKRPEVRKLNTTETGQQHRSQNRAQPITTPPCSCNFSPFKVQTDHSVYIYIYKISRRKKENQTLKKHDRSRQDQAIL